MQQFFMKFHVKGEIASTLFLREPTRRLLVDLSSAPATSALAPGYRYPNQVSFMLRSDALIERFRAQMTPGQMIEATGTFEQSGYIPHRTSHIDTTFLMLDFKPLGLPIADLSHAGRIYTMPSQAWMN